MLRHLCPHGLRRGLGLDGSLREPGISVIPAHESAESQNGAMLPTMILLAAWFTSLTAGSTAFGGEVIYRTSFEKQLAPWFSYFARGLVWDDSRAYSGTRSPLIKSHQQLLPVGPQRAGDRRERPAWQREVSL